MKTFRSSHTFDRTHPSKQKDSVSPPVELLDDKVHLRSFLLSINEERRERSYALLFFETCRETDTCDKQELFDIIQCCIL